MFTKGKNISIRLVYRTFTLTWPTANLLEQKKDFSKGKRFNFHRTGLDHQHGSRFIVLEQNIADVTSCENAPYAGTVVCQLPVPFVC